MYKKSFLRSVAPIAVLLFCYACQTEPLHTIEMESELLPEAIPLSSSNPGNWKLVWEDNFDFFDTDKWVTVDAPGGINGELQYHRQQNRWTSNGNLVITARSENFGGRDYTSAKIASIENFEYGKFEFRAKLAATKGLHSALWLVQKDCSANVPCATWPPEIDIVEGLGDQTTTAYQTVHYQTCEGCRWPNWDFDFSEPTVSDFSQNWHEYSVEWFEDVVRWYIDGQMTKEWYPGPGALMPSEAMRIIIDIAVGGSFPGNPDSSTQLPQTMLVDYVRVYRKNENTTPPPSGNMFVRARGRTGEEIIKLQLDGQVVATYNLSQQYADYYYSGPVSGKKVEVVFDNDGGLRDVFVDFVASGSLTVQAEDRPINTAIWQNGSCGGGFSEEMNCGGLIDFGVFNGSSTGSPGTIKINARGIAGEETLELLLDGQVVAQYTLSTSSSEYSYSGNIQGKIIKISFTNDGANRDVVLDNIVVNGQTIEAESRPSNTAVWQNGSCGGAFSELMNCNGNIDFGIF